jgi:hypothetical protein
VGVQSNIGSGSSLDIKEVKKNEGLEDAAQITGAYQARDRPVCVPAIPMDDPASGAGCEGNSRHYDDPFEAGIGINGVLRRNGARSAPAL